MRSSSTRVTSGKENFWEEGGNKKIRQFLVKNFLRNLALRRFRSLDKNKSSVQKFSNSALFGLSHNFLQLLNQTKSCLVKHFSAVLKFALADQIMNSEKVAVIFFHLFGLRCADLSFELKKIHRIILCNLLFLLDISITVRF